MNIVATLWRVALVSAFLIPSYEIAHARCLAHKSAVNLLAKKYGESVTGRGLAAGNKIVVELFLSKKGTWTLVSTNTKGASCILAAGKGWSGVPILDLDPQL